MSSEGGDEVDPSTIEDRSDVGGVIRLGEELIGPIPSLGGHEVERRSDFLRFIGD